MMYLRGLEDEGGECVHHATRGRSLPERVLGP